MTSVTFRLDEAQNERFDGLAADLGLNKSSIIRDALAAKLDELEEVRMIQQRLKDRDSNISSTEMWEKLGLTG